MRPLNKRIQALEELRHQGEEKMRLLIVGCEDGRIWSCNNIHAYHQHLDNVDDLDADEFLTLFADTYDLDADEILSNHYAKNPIEIQ